MSVILELKQGAILKVLLWLTWLIDMPLSMNSIVQTGVTSLSIASRNGHVNVVRLLLDNMPDAELAGQVHGVHPSSSSHSDK